MHSTLNRFVKSISTYSSMALIHIPRVVEVAQEKVFGASTVSVSVVAKVLDNLEEAARKCGRSTPPQLVAASKKQPVSKIQLAYKHGVRHFGENYVQELESKARYLKNHTDCRDIKWHFIGHLQRRRTKLLMNVPGLWTVETVDSVKIAKILNNSWALRDSSTEDPLKVLVQVNASSEDSKHGCVPVQCMDLIQYILKDCDHLDFRGFMTIGRLGHRFKEDGPNPDFLTLVKCHDKIKECLKINKPLEMSMGMSGDYEHAIELGSTSVRIGTALFGSREGEQ